MVKSSFDISKIDYRSEAVVLGRIVEKTARILFQSVEINQT